MSEGYHQSSFKARADVNMKKDVCAAIQGMLFSKSIYAKAGRSIQGALQTWHAHGLMGNMGQITYLVY